MDLEELQRETVTWPTPLYALANHGGQPTRRQGGRTIDHIAYRGLPATPGPIPVPLVLDDWDLSDHFPVLARFPKLVANRAPPTAAPTPAGLPRIFVKRPETRTEIASTNRWASLLEEFEDDPDPYPDDPAPRDPEGPTAPDPAPPLEHLSTRWTETCHAVAEDLSLTASDNPRPITVPRVLVRAVRRRRKTFRTYRQALQTPNDAETITVTSQQYEDAKRRSKKAIRHYQAKAWHRQIRLAHAQMIHRPREFWTFSSRHGRWRTKGAPAGLQPIYASDGTLLTNQPAILARWAQHYEMLGTDVTGHSQQADYWQHLDPQETRQPPITELDAAFTRIDVWDALSRMKRHKAPGHDGIPTDFLQACLQENKDSPEENAPPRPCPMTDCLCSLLNAAYEQGELPVAWEESVVLSLPKDGDLADCANYRGISLMPTTLKTMAVILAARISRAGEDRNLFSVTQAGFRKLEECVTQAACVVDILQRRRIAGETTYATFVDLKKAYDTVPHEALFAKLSQFGIHGQCLAFLRCLYARSKITVRVGSGNTAAHSAAFPLRRGLRQG